jgi:hypothetical protein
MTWSLNAGLSKFSVMLRDTEILVYPLPEGAPVPPELESPHALIEPSALRAAKAKTFEAILVYPISEGAPYIKIYSNSAAFAAIKADGSIKVWGDSDYGGSGAPYDKDYTEIYSNSFAFVALKARQRLSQLNKSWYRHHWRAHLHFPDTVCPML